MKRAALFACLIALATPAFAQAPSATGGPMLSQAERDTVAARVRGGASCARCDLFQIDLSYQALTNRNFSGSRIRQADFSLATADGASFNGANLSLTNFFGIRASRSDFRDANLDEAIMVGGYYGGANFRGARLRGANISGSDLSNAIGLTQTQLSEACGDAATTLPAGLTTPGC